MKLHQSGGEQPAQPGLVGQLDRLAAPQRLDHHVVLQVGDDLARLLRTALGVVDPQHGFVAPCRGEALRDAAVAPQHPDFVAALLPAVGGLRGDDDGLRPPESDSSTAATAGLASATASSAARIAHAPARHRSGGTAHGVCGVRIARHRFPGPCPGPWPLRLRARQDPNARSEAAAHCRPVEFVPACFSRIASLLGPLPESAGRPAESRKTKRQQSLRKVPGVERADYNGEP